MGILDDISKKLNDTIAEANEKVKELALSTKEKIKLKLAFEKNSTKFTDIENILKTYNGTLDLEKKELTTRSCDELPENVILSTTINNEKIKFQVVSIKRQAITQIIDIKNKQVEVVCDISTINVLL